MIYRLREREKEKKCGNTNEREIMKGKGIKKSQRKERAKQRKIF